MSLLSFIFLTDDPLPKVPKGPSSPGDEDDLKILVLRNMETSKVKEVEEVSKPQLTFSSALATVSDTNVWYFILKY